MIALDSPAWGQLRHAYGPASNIPDLLRRRFDLLDEYTSVPLPKFSTARAQPLVHRETKRGLAGSNWRYGLAGAIAILLVVLSAL